MNKSNLLKSAAAFAAVLAIAATAPVSYAGPSGGVVVKKIVPVPPVHPVGPPPTANSNLTPILSASATGAVVTPPATK